MPSTMKARFPFLVKSRSQLPLVFWLKSDPQIDSKSEECGRTPSNKHRNRKTTRKHKQNMKIEHHYTTTMSLLLFELQFLILLKSLHLCNALFPMLTACQTCKLPVTTCTKSRHIVAPSLLHELESSSKYCQIGI